eukprot:7382946-Prymnesium_polylepis.1
MLQPLHLKDADDPELLHAEAAHVAAALVAVDEEHGRAALGAAAVEGAEALMSSMSASRADHALVALQQRLADRGALPIARPSRRRLLLVRQDLWNCRDGSHPTNTGKRL